VREKFLFLNEKKNVFSFRLNTIREICSRCYLAMDEDLLHDLSKYKSYRDKSVAASARSLIQLFREKNPQLLERKDRGKPTEFQRDLIPLNYGQSNPKSYLEGAEILEQENISNDQEEEDQQTDDDDEEEDWVEVSQSEDEDEEEEEKDEKVSID
jgi:protein SDA1